MKLLKHILFNLSHTTFRILLITFLNLLAFSSLFGNSDYLKKTLYEQSIYEDAVPYLLSSNAESEIVENSDIKLGDAQVLEALNRSFPPSDLRSATETVIDSGYLWLNGENDKIKFSIDLSQNKQVLADEFTEIAIRRLENLPICKNFSVTTLDPFVSSCVPVEIDVDVERKAISEQIMKSSGVLEDPVVTDDQIIGVNDDRFDVANSQLSEIFKRRHQIALLLLTLLIALSTLQISLFKSKRKGLQKLGYSVFATGTGFIIISLVFTYVLPLFTGTLPLLQSSGTGLDGLVNRLTLEISRDYTLKLLLYALPVTLAGGSIYLWLKLKKQKITYSEVKKQSGVVSSNDQSSKRQKIQKKKPPVQSSEDNDRKKVPKKNTKYRKIPRKEV